MRQNDVIPTHNLIVIRTVSYPVAKFYLGLFFVKYAEKEILNFKSYLQQLPQVIYIVEEIGMCDIDIEVMLPMTQNLFSLIDSIKLDFPTLIREYELLIVRKTLKINYLPF